MGGKMTLCLVGIILIEILIATKLRRANIKQREEFKRYWEERREISKNGDRIVATADSEVGGFYKTGDTGTVVDARQSLVQFDKVEGKYHVDDGRWFVPDEDMKLLEEKR